MIDRALRGLIGKILFVYLDDVIVYGRTLEEHNKNLIIFLERLREVNLKLQPDKCEYLKAELQYLGHVITKEGVKPNPEKIKSVVEFERPINVKKIREFLGLTGWYRKFIKDYSLKAQPLTKLLQKKIEFTWNNEQEKAFNTLKEELCKEPILLYPDFTKPFTLTCDASGYALGGILSQEKNGKQHPVAYTSRSLNKAEKNYSTTDKEALAIVWCVKHFRPYLFGRKFNIITDHRPLVYLKNLQNPQGRLARWIMQLSEYEFEIAYKKGNLNTNADALSRNPVLINRRMNADDLIEQDEEMEEEEDDDEMAETGRKRRRETKDKRPRKELRRYSSQLEELNQKESEESIEGNQPEEVVQEFPPEEIEIEPEEPAIVKLGKQLFLTNAPVPEGSVDVSFVKDENPEEIEVYSDEDNREYHVTIGINIRTTIEDLLSKITELKYLAIAEEFKELHIDHDSCVQLSGLPRKNIEKLWQEQFRNGNTTIFLHENRRIIPQQEDFEKILKENHDSVIGGHGGVKKTYYRILENYFWKSLRRDVENYVKNCQTCQRNKVNRHPTRMPMIITDIPKKFNDKIAMDICGPFPLTSQRNKYVLTIQDCLTKFFVGIPLKDFTAATIIQQFVKHYISYFGVPHNILTDKGTNFTSDLMKNFEKMIGIKHITTTSFHPQSNGSLERSHQVLKDFLRHFTNENADNWDDHIHLANLYYNTSKHESTGYTPCELVFGDNPRDVSSVKKSLNIPYTTYLEELRQKITKNINECKRILAESRERTKERYDRMTNPQDFRPGDLIWLRKESTANDKTHALNVPFEGPYRILDKMSEVNYKIEKNNKEIVVHANRIKYANINLFQDPTD